MITDDINDITAIPEKSIAIAIGAGVAVPLVIIILIIVVIVVLVLVVSKRRAEKPYQEHQGKFSFFLCHYFQGYNCILLSFR